MKNVLIDKQVSNLADDEHRELLKDFDKSYVVGVDLKQTSFDENYQVYYKQTLRERKEIREDKRPDLYAKTTKNQSILCFVECE